MNDTGKGDVLKLEVEEASAMRKLGRIPRDCLLELHLQQVWPACNNARDIDHHHWNAYTFAVTHSATMAATMGLPELPPPAASVAASSETKRSDECGPG